MTREIRFVCPAAFPEGYIMEKKPKLSVFEGPDGGQKYTQRENAGKRELQPSAHGAKDTEKGLVKLNSLIPFSFSSVSRSMGLREVSLLLWVPCTGGTELSEWLQHQPAGRTETVV